MAPSKHWNTAAEHRAFLAEVLRQRRAGATYKVIGDRIGLSVERIRQLCNQAKAHERDEIVLPPLIFTEETIEGDVPAIGPRSIYEGVGNQWFTVVES